MFFVLFLQNMKPNERTLTRAQAKAAAVPRSKSPPPVARKVVKVPGLDGVIDLTVAFKNVAFIVYWTWCLFPRVLYDLIETHFTRFKELLRGWLVASKSTSV